jgi:hypothetical protein
VTQLVREVQHIGPDGKPVVVDYNPYGEYPPGGGGSGIGTYGRNGPSAGGGGRFVGATNYEHISEGPDYRTHSPASEVDPRRYADATYGRTTYADYEPYPQLAPPRPGGPPLEYAYQTAQPPGIYRDYPEVPMDPNVVPGALSGGPAPGAGGGLYGERPPTPPSPSEQSESPLPHHARGIGLDLLCWNVPLSTPFFRSIRPPSLHSDTLSIMEKKGLARIYRIGERSGWRILSFYLSICDCTTQKRDP